MGKLSKREIKRQQEVQTVLQKEHLTIDEIEYIYENYDPGYDTNVSEKGIYFTPLDLAQDFALFAPKHGHIVDLCGGIGMLSYKLICMSYYHNPIESITIIEQNKRFCEIGTKLLSGLTRYNHNLKWASDSTPIEINYINASMYDYEMWENITAPLKRGKFDLCTSNPPYGKAGPNERVESSWLNYTGERELMALELAHRYSNHAHFIIPPSSCEFQYSGRPYYGRRPSKKIDRFKKANPDMFFYMEAEGIDASIYRDEWKGTSITTEVANISFDRSEYN